MVFDCAVDVAREIAKVYSLSGTVSGGKSECHRFTLNPSDAQGVNSVTKGAW
jgi:hypothetical protein